MPIPTFAAYPGNITTPKKSPFGFQNGGDGGWGREEPDCPKARQMPRDQTIAAIFARKCCNDEQKMSLINNLSIRLAENA
jgi:hypothetical protein